MNTSFRNSNIGFILYALIITIIAGVFLITVWYMMWGYRLGTYSEGTVIGSVYLGGLQENELEQKVNQKVDIWLDDPTIVFELTYQGYSYEFDRNKIYFDLDESKDRLKQGVENELVAEYQVLGDRDDYQLVVNEIRDLEFLEDIIDNVDVEKIVEDILHDASLMKTYSSKKVEHYLIDPDLSYTDVATLSVHVPEGINVEDLNKKLIAVFGTNGLVFKSEELFDIVHEFTKEDIVYYDHEYCSAEDVTNAVLDVNGEACVEGAMKVEDKDGEFLTISDIEMTMLAQAMLQLSHETNFVIHEVHYTPRYDIGDYTFETFHFGSNVSINRPESYSFSMYNPNDSDYTFKVEEDTENQGNILVTLYGLDFVNTIDVTINVQELAYFTQTTENPLLLQDGEVGAVVTVHRVITDINESILFDQDIIFEYYQPKSEILLED